MKIRVERNICNASCTIGEMTVDQMFECYTLEDAIREEKIKGETAIPAGTYEVVITFSNRFQRDLPLLKEVPNFEGIRIHPGNTNADTEGCILVGRNHTDKTVTESRAAFNTLFAKIQQALNDGDTVSLEIG